MATLFKAGDRVTYLGYEVGIRDGRTVVFDTRKRWKATVTRVGRETTPAGQELFVQVDADQPGNSRAGMEHQVFARRDGVKAV